MRIERVQRTSAQFEDELSPRTSLGLHAVFNPLNRSVRIQQNGDWKGIGGVIVEMLVSVQETR